MSAVPNGARGRQLVAFLPRLPGAAQPRASGIRTRLTPLAVPAQADVPTQTAEEPALSTSMALFMAALLPGQPT